MSPEPQKEIKPLTPLGRFYVYALHGFATEVLFTAGWEFVVNHNWKFPGNTSVWSFFIYGLSCMVIEQMYLRMRHNVPLLMRAFIYTLWCYVWEFATGWILTQFNACAWDYTIFDYHYMGLVTPLYAPAWYLGNVALDAIVIRQIHQLHFGPKEGDNVPRILSNGSPKQKDQWSCAS